MHVVTPLITLPAGALWCGTASYAGTESAPPAPEDGVRITAGEEWRPVDVSSPWPRPGSALDVSRSVSHAPAGKHGRVIVGTEGHFAFEKRPNERVRFCGQSMGPEWAFVWRPMQTKAEIEAYAELHRPADREGTTHHRGLGGPERGGELPLRLSTGRCA